MGFQSIMSFLQMGLGAVQEGEATKLRNKADGLTPPLEDPEMRQYLGYLERKRRAIATGADYSRDATKLGQQLANTQTGIVQAGGSGGGTISGLLQAQRGAGDAYGSLVQKGRAEGLQYEGLVNSTLDKISQRKGDLQLLQYNQAMAEAAAKKKQADENLYGGLSSIGGSGGGGGSTGGASSGYKMGGYEDTVDYNTDSFA